MQCLWTCVRLPREGVVTSMHHSAQKSSDNSSLHILLLKYLVLPPPCLSFLSLYISNSLLVCPQPPSLFTTCSYPVLLAQIPSMASCVNENGVFQIAQESLCWTFWSKMDDVLIINYVFKNIFEKCKVVIRRRTLISYCWYGSRGLMLQMCTTEHCA